MSHVTVKLKRPIILHLPNSTTHYPKGLNVMPKEHADHLFVRLHQEGEGVVEEIKTKPIIPEDPPDPPQEIPAEDAGTEEEKEKRKRGSK